MRIVQKDSYLLIEDEANDLTEFATELTRGESKLKNNNVVVNLGNKPDLTTGDLLLFLEISNLHRLQKRSFVVVCNAHNISIDAVPEELMVAPTLREAEDIINMEELERDLGF